MDTFGLHIAYKVENDGKDLSKNSVISFHRTFKLWQPDAHSMLRARAESKLMRKGKTLEQHCQKRTEGGHANKATKCRKDDFCVLIEFHYANASCANDNHVAALLYMKWHCFRRASDLGFM